MYILNNKNVKCRIYEDDFETTVHDLNNNIRRRTLMTNSNKIIIKLSSK